MRCASTSLWTLVRRPSTSIDTRLCNPANPYSPALSDRVHDGFVVGKSDNHLSDSSRREMATLKVAEIVVFPCFSRSHHLCTKFTGSWSCMEAWHSTKLIPSLSRLLDRCPSTVPASCQVSCFVASAVSLLLLADSLCHLALLCPQAYSSHPGHPFAERPMSKWAPACPMMGTSPQPSGDQGCSRFHDKAWESYFLFL